MFLADKDVEAELVKARGQKLTDLIIRKAPSRICGLVSANGRSVEWEKAFSHIAIHFKADPSKPTNTVFNKKYCDEFAVKELIKRAAGRPSSVNWTNLTLEGRPSGRLGIKIVRDFGEPVGDKPDLVCLRVLADDQGNLLTAYPVTRKDS